MRFFRSKRRVVVCSLILLALLFLIRPGANRLRTRITSSISLALGRSVDVASAHVRLLPHPGFDLENFVVHDDPAFSAEPMLHAAEVTASLRLMSLLHGRLEIARLDLAEPSLNLVRDKGGHWNLESLLERAEKIPLAPTAKARREARPQFPYIDCSGGRINLKLGAEKKPYALTDADFSLWQDSENAWGMRLKARPVRTDFNLTDTGILQISGSWQRASTLPQTPMQFIFAWQGAQLGQLTKLASGNDQGWRGSLSLSATLTGTPADSKLAVDASAVDFRRFDVLGGGNLRLAAHCAARYSSMDRALSEIDCRAPVGEGVLAVNGRIAAPLTFPTYDFVVTARAIPLQSLIALMRHSRKGVPDGLLATGQVNAQLRASRQNSAMASWEGDGRTSTIHLQSRLTDAELVLNDVPFTLSGGQARLPAPSTVEKTTFSSSKPQLNVGPFRISLGRPSPMVVQGSIGAEGYDFDLKGEAQIHRLLQTAQMIGIPVADTSADGIAKFDLQLSRNWSSAEPLRATGKAQLHATRTNLRGFNSPLEIADASLTLSPEQVTVQNLSASAEGSLWTGSLLVARPCSLAVTCTVHFDLHANEIGIDRLNQLFNPEVREKSWYQILSSSASSGSSNLLAVNASGKLSAARVTIGKLEAKHVTASLELKSGKLRISNFQGDILGGRHRGEWRADFAAKPPEYSGSGTFQKVALAQVAQAMNSDWIMGTANASYRANTSGLTAKQLFASAKATLDVDASAAVLPHVVLTDSSAPLQIRHLAAHLVLHDGRLEIQTGTLETASDVFHLNGTASLTQTLNLRLMREGAPGFNITGTLARPHVAPMAASETSAALKP